MYVSFNEHCSFLSTKFSSIDTNNTIDRLYCTYLICTAIAAKGSVSGLFLLQYHHVSRSIKADKTTRNKNLEDVVNPVSKFPTCKYLAG